MDYFKLIITRNERQQQSFIRKVNLNLMISDVVNNCITDDNILITDVFAEDSRVTPDTCFYVLKNFG
jgi:hypothetical protein